jgi:hypothetical protein
MDTYDDDCEKIRDENEKLLKEFGVWLEASKLVPKTVKGHVSNVDFYINEFLLYEEPVQQAQDGIYGVRMFFGYWFIKKASWATPASIKSNAASLTKFYTFLLGKGLVDQEALDEWKAQIKEEMPEWVATMKRYDDPSIEDMDEVWGI